MGLTVNNPSFDRVYPMFAYRDNNIRLVLTQGEGATDIGVVFNQDGTVDTEHTAETEVVVDHIKVPKFQLQDEQGLIDLTNCEVALALKRPDGSEDLLHCDIEDATNGIVSCPITAAATEIAGQAVGEIRVLSANGIIKFSGVHASIYPGVSDEAAMQSTQFSALVSALQKVALLTPEGTIAEMDEEIVENGVNPVASGVIYDALAPMAAKLTQHDTEIAGKADSATTLAGYGITDGMKYSYVENGSVNDCDQPDTVYNIYVNSGVVTAARALVFCVPISNQKLVQYALTRSDFIIFRNRNNGVWDATWDYIPNHAKMVAEIRQAIIQNENGMTADKTLDIHNTPVSTYMSTADYSSSDYTTTNLPNSLSARADIPNTVAVTIPNGGNRIVIKDTQTGFEWTESVSGSSHALENLIPNRTYFYNILNATDAVLSSGVCKTSGQVRMINGSGNTFNIRDLGGWKCFDGNTECGTLKYGMMYRGARLNGTTGGNPAVSLDGTQIAYFKNVLGIRDEIDLRGNTDTAQITDTALGAGVDYVRINIAYYQYSLHDAQNSENTARYAALIKRIAKDIKESKPIYLHCASGADRTAQVCALVEAICGVRQTDIDRDYELTWFAFETNGGQLDTRRRNYASSNGGGDWNKFINGSHITGVEDIDGLAEMSGSSFTDKVVRYLLRAGVTIDEINTIRFGLIGGNPAKLTSPYGAATITKNLTNISLDNNLSSVAMYQPFEARVTADNFYRISQFSVTMGGVDCTAQYYQHGVISIPHVTGNVVIAGSAIEPRTVAEYGITNAYTKRETQDLVVGTVDDAFIDDMSIDNIVDQTYNPDGHYIMHYVDGEGVRHNLFDFSNYFAGKSEIPDITGKFDKSKIVKRAIDAQVGLTQDTVFSTQATDDYLAHFLSDYATVNQVDATIEEYLDALFLDTVHEDFPSLHIDNTVDQTYNPNGHYIMYYIDSALDRHNIFDFSVLPMSYTLTAQDKADIADIVLGELPTTQGVLYGNTSN